MKIIPLFVALALALARHALAEPPQVATDIPPVHSLVARVMQGVAEPALILPPGASPHGYSMRPSEAAALAGAEVVVWTGEALTPWLARAVATLAQEAITVELLETEGTLLLGFREGASFALHAHKAEHAGDDEAEGAEHAHGDAHTDANAHAHGGVDPHAWLDPKNAQAWLGTIAAALSEADPANAAAYARNAAEGRAELDAVIGEITAALATVQGRPFVVFHDAFHYFEHRFGLEAVGALALSDASSPSAQRVAEIREAIRATGARCVFAEPQFARDLVGTVIEGTPARAATLDPLGAALAPGPGLYPELLRRLAAELSACLNAGYAPH